MEQTAIPLPRLTHGEHINARRSGPVAFSDLTASIDAHGLLEPLIVRPGAGVTFEVIAGNRRLSALQQLASKKRIAAEYPVPCVVRDLDDLQAFEASLAENVVRLPTHPIDQYEAFAHVQKTQQLGPAAIAKRFGVKPRQVEQMLALGDLHPDIRAAWRKGEIGDEQAQTFTLARGDQNRQKAIFDKLKKSGRMWSNSIATELGSSNDVPTARMLRAVDREAYEARGGAVVEDLFGKRDSVSNPELLQEMLAEKIRAHCEELVADGWARAIDAATVKDKWNWKRQNPKAAKPDAVEAVRLKEITARLDLLGEIDKPESGEQEEIDALEEEQVQIQKAIDGRAWTAKAKKKLGCMVGLSNGGAIEVECGFERPEDTKAAERAKKKKEADKRADAGEPPPISNSLTHDLSIQMSRAVSLTLAEADPMIAIAALYAALASELSDTPIKLRFAGIPAFRGVDIGDIDPDPATLFANARAMEPDDLLRSVAKLIGQCVELRKHHPRPHDPEEVALLNELPPDIFEKAAAKVFDARDYFKRAPVACAIEALEEMGEPAPKGNKGAVVQAACEAQEKHGWVPVDLRQPS